MFFVIFFKKCNILNMFFYWPTSTNFFIIICFPSSSINIKKKFWGVPHLLQMCDFCNKLQDWGIQLCQKTETCTGVFLWTLWNFKNTFFIEKLCRLLLDFYLNYFEKIFWGVFLVYFWSSTRACFFICPEVATGCFL